MIDVKALVKLAKEKYPAYYADMDDNQIYHVIKKRYPENAWPESSPYDIDVEVNPTRETFNAKDQDYSPSTFSNIALAGLPEIWADKHDWAKKAYNHSMSGLMYQTIHGKPKYKVEEYDAPIWEDAVGFFAGLVSPLDVALFIGTGGLGGAAGKEVGKRTIVKSMNNAIAEAGTAKVRDKIFARKLIAETALESGFSLGTYGAAGGAIAEAARQSEEGLEDFDYGKIVAESGKAFLSGSIIGAASGGVAKGIMSPKFAKAAMSAKSGDNSFKNLSTRLLNNPLSQVIAEGQLFTAGQLTEQALLSDQDITMDDYFRGVFTNTGIVGGMRASTKVLRLGQNDMTRYKKARREHYETLQGKYGTVLDNVKKELGEAGIKAPPELMDQMIKQKLQGQEQEAYFNWIKNQEKDLYHLMENKDFKNLTPAEQAKAVQGYTALNNIYIDMYSKLIKDKGLRDRVFESENKKLPTEGQSKAQLKKYEALLEKHKQISKFKNEFGLGDNKKGNETLRKFIDKEEIVLDKKTQEVKVGVDLKKISDNDLIRYAADAKERKFEEIRKEFTTITEKKTPLGIPEKIETLNRESLIDYIGTSIPKPKEGFGAKILTSDELVAKFKDSPSAELKSKSIDIANELDRLNIKYNPASNNKLNESYYDILEIATKHFPERETKKGARAGADVKGTILVEAKTDIAYIKTYSELAKYLNEQGKSIREASWDDVRNFIVTAKSGSNNALAVLYRRIEPYLQDSLRREINNIQGVKAGYAEKPFLGLRINNIDKDGNVSIVPSKSLTLKEVPTSEKLKTLLKKITNKITETDEAGTTLWRSLDGKAVVGTKLNQIVKKYFGGNVAPKDFRKALSQYITTAYGANSKEFAIIEAIGLGHRQFGGTKKEQRAYIKDVKLSTEYVKLRNEFINKIFNKEALTEMLKGEYKDGGITVEQLRKGFDKLFAEKEVEIKIGGKKYSKEMLEGMFRYMIETSPRPQDVVPIKLSDINKKISKRVKPGEEILEPVRDTLAPDRAVIPASKAQIKRRQDWASKKYPEIEIKLVDKLKSNAEGKEVLGELVGHTAKIVKGKAPADAIPHEITHHVFNVLEAIGTPESKRLMDQAIKAFDSKEKAVTRIGELVDGRLEKGLIPKAKAWAKRFNIFLKNLFGSPIKGKDAAFLLGEMVYKKKGVATTVSPKDAIKAQRETLVAPIKKQYGSPDMFRKVVRRNFEVATEHLGSKDKQSLIKYVLEEVLGVPKEQFKKLIYKVPEKMNAELEAKYLEHLNQFNTVIETSGVEKLRRMKDVTGFFRTVRKIENIKNGERIIRNIGEKQQKTMLIALGVKDGNIWKASKEQLNDYLHELHKIAVKERSEPTFISEVRDLELANRKDLTKFQQILKQVEGAVLPVVDVIESLGFPELASRLKKHVGVESRLYGEGHQLMNYDITHGYVRKTKGGKTIETIEPISGTTIILKNRNYEKLRDNMSSVDHRGEMYLESLNWIKNKDLSYAEKKKLQAEIDFFDKAIKKEWKKTIKKDGNIGDPLNALDSNGKFKYINLKTDEGKIIARYADPVVGMPVYYKNAYLKALKSSMNDAQLEAYKKQGDIRWIEDGIYITRSVTDKFKNTVNLDNVAFEKLIEGQATKIAMEQARQHHGVVNPTEAQIAQFMEMGRGIAIGNISDANNFSFNKFSTKFLMKRHEKLPMFIKDKDANWVRTYENTFDGTAKKYAVGMSKYIAGIELFPEFGNIPGAKIPGAKVQIQELRNLRRGKEWADYIQEAVDHQLGIGKSSPFNLSIGAVQGWANILAKTQLSSPLSGVKNAFLASTQAAWAYDMLDIGRGMADVFRQENQIYVTKTGAKHLGVRHYEGGKLSKALDKTLFAAGLMRPTEGWARAFSVLTGKIDQKKHVEYLRSNPKESKLYNKSKIRLKKFYELTDADIKLLEKYGYGHGKKLDGFKFESKSEQSRMERKLEIVHEQMNTMAHIKTQGASIALFMPSIASKSAVKPLTLYKRMAYAASVNTAKNVKEAVQTGNILRLASGTLATYFSGQALLGLYSSLLGNPTPKENSGWWENFKTSMWRGEFMGLFSEYLSPFGEAAYMSLYPSILENAANGVVLLNQVIEGKKHVWGKKQAVDSYLRSLVSIYNASQHVVERRNNPYNRKSVKFNQLYKEFEDEVYPNKPNMEFEATTKTPYFTMLNNAFTKGNSKEFAEAFVLSYYALASDYYNKGFEINGVRHYSKQMAYKKANETMKRKMKALNPNRGRTQPKSKIQTKAREYSWHKWLGKDEKYLKELKELENDYKIRLLRFKSEFPYFVRKNNLLDLRKEFDWIDQL
jgi:hypothetical protein